MTKRTVARYHTRPRRENEGWFHWFWFAFLLDEGARVEYVEVDASDHHFTGGDGGVGGGCDGGGC